MSYYVTTLADANTLSKYRQEVKDYANNLDSATEKKIFSYDDEPESRYYRWYVIRNVSFGDFVTFRSYFSMVQAEYPNNITIIKDETIFGGEKNILVVEMWVAEKSAWREVSTIDNLMNSTTNLNTTPIPQPEKTDKLTTLEVIPTVLGITGAVGGFLAGKHYNNKSTLAKVIGTILGANVGYGVGMVVDEYRK